MKLGLNTRPRHNRIRFGELHAFIRQDKKARAIPYIGQFQKALDKTICQAKAKGRA